jgi:2-dehydro-3-deoxy-D-arabinonate dehydratase
MNNELKPTGLTCFHLPGHGRRLGLLQGDVISDLTSSGLPELASLGNLVRASVDAPIADILAQVDSASLRAYSRAALDRAPDQHELHIAPPADEQEVWAAGVTYAWSREARVREAVSKEVYVRVYDAERPELFFKSLPAKVVGPNDWIGIRGDSAWNVPEPELTLLINPALQIIGYTVGNDVSSRDIEGENPLYLPQAKVYRHSCALGPTIALAGEAIDPKAMQVSLVISRDGSVAFEGETSTVNIHRDLDELAECLGRYYDLPGGAWLMTGTGIVPGDEFTLRDGDIVRIEIDRVGVLTNPVRAM